MIGDGGKLVHKSGAHGAQVWDQTSHRATITSPHLSSIFLLEDHLISPKYDNAKFILMHDTFANPTIPYRL